MNKRISVLLPTMLAISGTVFASTTPEQQCLDSFRLTLKDPDSGAVVANLGHRGLESLPNENFFLRYKAKNSYGGFISSNVICHKEGDRWVRNKLGEFSIKMGLANDCLRESIVSLEKGGPGRHNCEDYAERRFAGTDSLK